jgi:hypothetical protein
VLSDRSLNYRYIILEYIMLMSKAISLSGKYFPPQKLRATHCGLDKSFMGLKHDILLINTSTSSDHVNIAQ